jgi:hypothetical protein
MIDLIAAAVRAYLKVIEAEPEMVRRIMAG